MKGFIEEVTLEPSLKDEGITQVGRTGVGSVSKTGVQTS